jgi:hypothetical protein
MNGAINPLPQYAFMAWCLVKGHSMKKHGRVEIQFHAF